MSVKTLFAALVVLLALAACGGAPAESIVSEIEVTRVVDREVEVTRVVDVEVTRLVEVEVTRVVEPTRPPATATPDAPEEGTVQNPVPPGTTRSVTNGDGQLAEVTVSQVLRGAEAEQMAMAANSFNEPAPDGFEIVLALVDVAFVEGDGTLEIGNASVSAVTNSQIIGYFDFLGEMPCCIDPEFDLTLLPGGTGQGWAKMIIQADDPAPMMLLGDASGGVYFSLVE